MVFALRLMGIASLLFAVGKIAVDTEVLSAVWLPWFVGPLDTCSPLVVE